MEFNSEKAKDMNKWEHSETIEVIRYSLFGGDKPEVSNWDNVVCTLRQHCVLPLLYGMDVPEKYREEIKAAYYGQIASYARLMNEQQQLCDLLCENGITPIVLKGASAAQYYDNPEIRTVGDIDILVTDKVHFELAVALMRDNEYEFEDKNESLDAYERPEFRHVGFVHNGIIVELHARYARKYDMINRILEERIVAAEPILTTIGQWSFYSLPPLENGLVLLHHLSDHLMRGVGVRQLLDWAMFAKKVLDDEFWNELFCGYAGKIGLKPFAVYATRLCELYFGIPSHHFCEDADPEVCASLLRLIMDYGNFGRNMDAVSIKVKKNLNKGYMLQNLQRNGEMKSPLFKNKLLRPFAWIYQIFHALKLLLTRKQSISKTFRGIVAQKKDNTLFKELQIGKYRKQEMR